ncbi:hypothetical protein MHLP_02010 [Candidatus Mycoplasma haematolamae str. Purdue]|uniref:Uncharacterized protein n=1 Tax=Mycoplasma haematolamae (strain Purdue) TaxID=1212765 RepID=I7C669_MYCHA|nr:hypothetical protein [Candidatus Mycoplasma haematolamae]AFO51982.1 hypothetical protein MHLP_02010 [Candidatus Mycoplasma haematolamae str. Purdue]
MAFISPKVALLSFAGAGSTVGGGFGAHYVATGSWRSEAKAREDKDSLQTIGSRKLESEQQILANQPEDSSDQEDVSRSPASSPTESETSDTRTSEGYVLGSDDPHKLDVEEDDEEEPLEKISGNLFFVKEESSFFGGKESDSYSFKATYSDGEEAPENQKFSLPFESTLERRKIRSLIEEINGDISLDFWGINKIVDYLEEKSSKLETAFGNDFLPKLKIKLQEISHSRT